MKVLHGLSLLLLAACLEARPGDLRRELASNRCPPVDPQLYTVHLPHPLHCNMFLRCDHGTAKPERCPAQLHFNPVLQVCDWPLNAGCMKVDGGASEWDVNPEPQVEGPRQETPTLDLVPDKETPDTNVQEMPTLDPVPDKETPDTYVPSDWLDDADVQNEAIQDVSEGDGNAPSGNVDNEDIFDANIEYAT